MIPRPTALDVHAAAIPDVLKAEQRWHTWSYRKEGDRWAKRPNVSATNRRSWLTFEAAIRKYHDQPGVYDGIGFFIGDGWSGIDLDNCTTLPDLMGCYVERSPSGTGYKAIGRSATLIGGEANFALTPTGYTKWRTSPRPFVITGHGSGDPTVDISPLLKDWFSHFDKILEEAEAANETREQAKDSWKPVDPSNHAGRGRRSCGGYVVRNSVSESRPRQPSTRPIQRRGNTRYIAHATAGNVNLRKSPVS